MTSLVTRLNSSSELPISHRQTHTSRLHSYTSRLHSYSFRHTDVYVILHRKLQTNIDSFLMCPNHLLCNPEPDIDVSIPPPAHMTTSAGGGQCAQATNGGPLSGDTGTPGTLTLPPDPFDYDITSAANRSIVSTTGCTITEKAPTRAFSWLKAPTSAFTFKTLC